MRTTCCYIIFLLRPDTVYIISCMLYGCTSDQEIVSYGGQKTARVLSPVCPSGFISGRGKSLQTCSGNQRVHFSKGAGLKRPVREADYSPRCSAEVPECVKVYMCSPLGFHCVHRDKFILTFTTHTHKIF